MGPRLAKSMGPGDGHRGPNRSDATVRRARRARRPREGPTFGGRYRWRAAALVRGWTGSFFTGAEGGGGSLSMLGLSRDRKDSPSTTRSKALFLNWSTALWASSASSNAAIHSAVSRLLVTTVERRALRSTKSW